MQSKNSNGIRKTNEWVLETAGMERGLLNIIKRRKLSYFEHVMRKRRRFSGERSQEALQGTTPGARKQGKPRMLWMDNMEEWTGMPFEDLLNKTRDRKKWSTLVMKRPTLGARMVEDKTRQDKT